MKKKPKNWNLFIISFPFLLLILLIFIEENNLFLTISCSYEKKRSFFHIIQFLLFIYLFFLLKYAQILYFLLQNEMNDTNKI